MNTIKTLIKYCLGTAVFIIIVPLAIISFSWYWEMNKAKEVLHYSLQALMVGNSPPNIDISFENQENTIIYGNKYSILHTDSLLVWGQWYCVKFDNGTDLGLEVYPSMFENHRVHVYDRDDC